MEVDKCIICGGKLSTETMCENCGMVLKALNENYNLYQCMALFRTVLGAKIVEDVALRTATELQEQYFGSIDKDKLN